jgi:hypothetical protein
MKDGVVIDGLECPSMDLIKNSLLAGSCECGNEPFSPIKSRKLTEWLSDY